MDNTNDNIGIIAELSPKRAIMMYLVVASFLIFEMALQVLPSVIAPSLMQDLQLTALLLGVMSGTYFYTYAGMQIPSGLLFDRFCAKNIIITALFLCALGAALFGLAHNFYIGMAARLLMGLGSAFAFVSVLVVASDLFKQQHFALIAGITQALAALGAMLGQFPASFAVSHLGWRQTLFLLALVGIVLAILVWHVLNYQVNQHPFTHHQEKSHIRHDLLHIIRSPQNWMIALYACLLWAPMSGFASLWGVPFLMRFDNLSLSQAAFVISMMWLGLAVGSPLLGLLANFLNDRIIPLRLSAITGFIAFSIVLIHPCSEGFLSITLFIAGAACSGQALSFAVIRKNNPERVKSTAIAFNNMAVVISGAIFQPLLGACIGFGERHAFTQPYQSASILIGLAYLGAVLLAIKLNHEQG